ncbi:MAG: O-antigen ligase family protein [Terracidiphilus sp.]
MGALSAQFSFATAGRGKPRQPAARRNLIFVGAPLLLLLLFTTSTVFVQQAWALQSFQMGIYALVAVTLLAGIGEGWENLAPGWTPWLVYLIPLWGMVQIGAHSTASSFETRLAVLRWGSLAGVFFLAQVVGRSQAARRIALHAFLFFAVAMAVLCLTQLFTSQGKVLWLFSSGYPDVYATFPNHNNYAQFVELALPIAVWWALGKESHSWAYALAAAVIYASVIGSASRAGAFLCTAELLILLGAGSFLSFRHRAGWTWRATLSVFAVVPVLAAVFTLAVGWQHVWQRFQQRDPFEGRREFLVAAIDMAKHRPLVGFGLDTFPEVYQRFAIVDLDVFANHAHNDWAEFAADGGIPFLLLVLIPFAAAVPIAIRHPWGSGLIAVMLHACVDYPFPRPAVSAWMFAMLALLYMAQAEDRRHLRRAPASAPADTT